MDDTSDQKPVADLNVRDIVNAMALLDVAAEQGAFRGWDVIQKAVDCRIRLQNFANATIQPTQTDAVPDGTAQS